MGEVNTAERKTSELPIFGRIDLKAHQLGRTRRLFPEMNERYGDCDDPGERGNHRPEQPMKERRTHGLCLCFNDCPDVTDIAQPFLRIFLKAALDQWPEVGWNDGEIRPLLHNRCKYFRNVFAFEWQVTRKQLVQNDAERPDVGAPIHWLATSLLRAHIGGCAEDNST